MSGLQFLNTMKRIPVHIISGFLGSGKTTTILNLLNEKKDDSHWAILINEFGKISIDSQTIRPSSTPGTVFDIAGGCICCSAKEFFQKDLEQIIHSRKFSRIIIEPSGLGGLDMVCEIVESIPSAMLMPIICLVDIFVVESKRLQLNLIYKSQIAKADLIVFSKCDLLNCKAEQERLMDEFKRLFPSKRNLLTNQANLFSWMNDERNPSEQPSNKLSILSIADHNLSDSRYAEKNFTFNPERIFNTDSLSRFFDTQYKITRAKGYLHTEKGWQLFNFTLSGCTFEPCQKKNQNELIIIAEQAEFSEHVNLNAELEKALL